MSAVLDYMRLCRLCLVKDKVHVPIFGAESDVRQIFLKITACLPVKVSQEDNLPKNICNSCLLKVDLLYQFWNTTVNAEKQLIQWLAEIGVDVNIKNTSSPNITPQSHAHPHSMPEAIILKEERPDPEIKSMEQSQNFHMDTQYSGYEMPYQPQVNMTVGAPTDFTQPTDAPAEEDVKVPQQKAQPTKPTPAKRRGRPPKQKTPPAVQLPPPEVPPAATSTATGSKRRSSAAAAAAAFAAAAANASSDESDVDDRFGGDDSDDEDMDVRIAKEEADSEDEEYVDNPESLEPTAFVGVPSTSACDSEQPGPSGLGGAITTGKTSSALPAAAANESGMCSKEGRGTQNEVDVKSLICPDCFLLCRDNAHLKQHRSRYHNTNPTACSECGKLFTIKKFLDDHYLKVHSIIPKFECPKVECAICGRTLSNKKSLKQHILRHDKKYNFYCVQCKQGYFQKRLLEEHIRIKHKGYRYICFPCDKTYADKSQFNLHMDSHNPASADPDVQSNYCAICYEVFPDKTKLLAHKRTHYDGHKLHICDICGKTLANSTSLHCHKMQHNPESRFSCTECEKQFTKKTDLTVHINFVHLKTIKFECNICGLQLAGKKNLELHQLRHTNKYKFRCEQCDQGFNQKRLLEEHIRVKHEGFRYICFPCDKVYSCKTCYTFHMDSHNPATSSGFKCTICNEILPSKKKLVMHRRTHYGNDNTKTCICDICGASLLKSSLQAHKMHHTGDARFTCSVCDKKFLRKDTLKFHCQRVHWNIAKFECTICGRNLLNKTSLQHHMASHTKEYEFKCEHCTKGFVKKYLLEKHVRVAHEGFRHICFPCNKTFSDQTWYKIHMDMHNPKLTSEGLEFICPHCNEAFPDKKKLFLHRRIHYIKSKSFICEICGVSMKTKTILRQHKMRHNGESRFMCATCGKTFVTPASFHSHLQVHNNIKPYECSECGKSFALKSTLNSHKRLHTGERPYPCRFCEKKFNTNSALKVHCKTHGTPLSDIKTGSITLDNSKSNT